MATIDWRCNKDLSRHRVPHRQQGIGVDNALTGFAIRILGVMQPDFKQEDLMRKKTTIQTAAGFLGILFILSAIVPVGGEAAEKIVRLAYVEWSETIASTHLVQAVLQEKMGVPCETIPMTADKMWEAVASGKADAMVAAWLPSTHGHYYQQFKERLVDLGPNLEGTQIGLVVPDITVGRQTAATGQRNAPYITVDSIPELKNYARKFQRKIIGIDPEAGIMKKAKEAMQVYDLSNFRLIEGSEISMTAELSDAIRKQKWIVVTGWIPHWMFARWKLKFLDDPKNVFGGKEKIHTMARKGLREDMPEVYRFLDAFNISAEQLGQLTIWVQEDDGMFAYDKALRYMRYHQKQVQSWLK
jgi:glycine betaine/proline transport system substrate-binding protein